MSIKQDADSLAEIMEQLGLNDTQNEMVIDLILILKPIIKAYTDLVIKRDGLTESQAVAVVIAALSTQTIAYTVHRSCLDGAVSIDDYLKDL